MFDGWLLCFDVFFCLNWVGCLGLGCCFCYLILPVCLGFGSDCYFAVAL